MKRTLPLLTAAISALVFGSLAVASRNSGGTYSLPTGNPVVSGTTITTTWANTTLSDLSTEITNSLDRGGRGAMTAPLQHSSGSQALPSITFSSDTDSGIWRAGADDIRVGAGNVEYQKWTGSINTFSKSLNVTATTGNAGITVSGSASGTAAITATGGAAASGITSTGGSTSGPGVTATGIGSGNGITATGGTTGKGGAFTGAIGVTGTGTGTTVGGSFANGTAATGGTRQDAITATNGDVNLAGVTYPTSTTSIANRVTPANIVKAWALITTNGAGGCTVTAGFNVTSCATPSAAANITWATAFSNTSYAVVAMVQSCTTSHCNANEDNSARTTTLTSIRVSNPSAGGTAVNMSSAATTFSVIVLGAQ